MKKAKTPQQENYIIQRTNHKERFEIITNYHLYDKRLTLEEKGFYTCLLTLPQKWKITHRATAEYLNISKNTFTKYIKSLKKHGYIELVKSKNNRTIYKLKEKPTIADFNPSAIQYYTIEELNAFLNDERIENRFKKLILKALEKAKETTQKFDELIAEIEEENSEELEQIELPF